MEKQNIRIAIDRHWVASDELRLDFQRFYGRNHPANRRVFEILEADDAHAFSGKA